MSGYIEMTRLLPVIDYAQGVDGTWRRNALLELKAPVCVICNAPLPAGRVDRRYCSSACRQRAHRNRNGAAGLRLQRPLARGA